MRLNQCFRSLHVGLPQDIARRRDAGDFSGALRLIDLRLSDPTLPKPLRDSLTSHREMILRTPECYPYTEDEAVKVVQQHIPDFTVEEFRAMVDAGDIWWIYIHG